MKLLAEETIAAYCNGLLSWSARCKIKIVSLLSQDVRDQIRLHKQSESLFAEGSQQRIWKKIPNKGTSTTVIRQSISSWASWGVALACLCLVWISVPNESFQAKGNALGVTLYSQIQGKAERQGSRFSLEVGDTIQAVPIGEEGFFLKVFAKDSEGLKQVCPVNKKQVHVSIKNMPAAMILDTPGENWLFFVSSLQAENTKGLQRLLKSWNGEHSLFLGDHYIQAYQIQGVKK